MRIKVLPYVTVDVDDQLRTKLRSSAERLRLNVRAYLLSAADDVDTAGDRVRGRFAAAAERVDDAVGKVTDRLDAGPADQRDGSDVRREAG
jgi:arylsulfatase A-like enzyme